MDNLSKSVNANKMMPEELYKLIEAGYYEAEAGQGRPLEEFELEFRKKNKL